MTTGGAATPACACCPTRPAPRTSACCGPWPPPGASTWRWCRGRPASALSCWTGRCASWTPHPAPRSPPSPTPAWTRCRATPPGGPPACPPSPWCAAGSGPRCCPTPPTWPMPGAGCRPCPGRATWTKPWSPCRRPPEWCRPPSPPPSPSATASWPPAGKAGAPAPCSTAWAGPSGAAAGRRTTARCSLTSEMPVPPPPWPTWPRGPGLPTRARPRPWCSAEGPRSTPPRSTGCGPWTPPAWNGRCSEPP